MLKDAEELPGQEKDTLVHGATHIYACHVSVEGQSYPKKMWKAIPRLKRED